MTFDQFAQKYRDKFRSIARATRGEIEPDDVQSEAWIQAADWELKGIEARFDEPSYVDIFFAHLYQKLVRYTETTVRMAVRLDHWAYGDNPDTDVHPLLSKLSAAQDTQPLEQLLAKEEAVTSPAEPGVHHTRASAYLVLVRRYRQCMRDIANHLLISLSYCYYRLKEARELAERQYALPDTLEQIEPNFMPGPWRSYRLYRPWVQLELDLELSSDLLSE